MVVVKAELTPSFEQILLRYLQSVYSTHDAQDITSKFMNVSNANISKASIVLFVDYYPCVYPILVACEHLGFSKLR